MYFYYKLVHINSNDNVKILKFEDCRYKVVRSIEINGLNGNLLITGPLTFSRFVAAKSAVLGLQLYFILM